MAVGKIERQRIFFVEVNVTKLLKYEDLVWQAEIYRIFLMNYFNFFLASC
jgi:hypothetical protein